MAETPETPAVSTKNNAANVTQGKPAVSGAIFRAPAGTDLPNDATTSLNSAFKCLGYVTKDGVTNSRSRSSSGVDAWGGDRVLNTTSSVTDEFKLKLMETLNPEVMKVVFGDQNVSGTLDTGITVKSNTATLETGSYVIDQVLKGGVLKRLVIPNATVTDTDDIEYKDDDATVYGITLGATPDDDGNTHYEYVQKAPGGENA